MKATKQYFSLMLLFFICLFGVSFVCLLILPEGSTFFKNISLSPVCS